MHGSGSRARLHASLIFVPESSEQVATGVKVMEFFDRPFAVRGRGHTLLPGMSGIENGILFSMERMDKIALTASKEIASLGPGNDWGRVFETLENDGVAVTGGTLKVVGVPGLLTGSMYSPISCALASRSCWWRIRCTLQATDLIFRRWPLPFHKQQGILQRRRHQLRDRAGRR